MCNVCYSLITIFVTDMKTNYMIALMVPAQWRVPWRLPEVNVPLNEASMEKLLDNKFQNILGRTVKGVQNYLIKNMLE